MIDLIKTLWLFFGVVILTVGLYIVFGKETSKILTVLDEYHDREIEKLRAEIKNGVNNVKT